MAVVGFYLTNALNIVNKYFSKDVEYNEEYILDISEQNINYFCIDTLHLCTFKTPILYGILNSK